MKVLVHYPPSDGRIVLRTETDWGADIMPTHVSADGTQHTFEVELQRAYSYFKPVLLRDGNAHWARGKNYLALAHAGRPRQVWPHFLYNDLCSVSELEALDDNVTGKHYYYRVFHPPGYAENTLKKYPVLYLQDGQNVFFRAGCAAASDQANTTSSEHDWRLAQTLTRLSDMNAVDKVLAVAVYPADRENDYALPGSTDYARFLAQTLKPHIDRSFRCLRGPQHTAIMGSSLGGVASFYTAWEWPSVFGMAACLSPSFGWRDDLTERVSNSSKRQLRIYLDSGWPHDNYEVTRDMRALLASRGWMEGRDLFYYAFPEAHHNEGSWAMRCHIPIQVFFARRPRGASAGKAVAPHAGSV